MTDPLSVLTEEERERLSICGEYIEVVHSLAEPSPIGFLLKTIRRLATELAALRAERASKLTDKEPTP